MNLMAWHAIGSCKTCILDYFDTSHDMTHKQDNMMTPDIRPQYMDTCCMTHKYMLHLRCSMLTW